VFFYYVKTKRLFSIFSKKSELASDEFFSCDAQTHSFFLKPENNIFVFD